MNLRKITAAALSLALACGIAAPFGISPKASGVSAVTANAADTEYESLTIDKCTYNVYPDHAAFNRCSVTVDGAIVIPEEVEGVPVTKINSHAFEKCGKLTSVSIPATVTEIGTTLAMNCHEMQEYRVDGKNPAFCALDGVLITKDMKKLVAIPPAYHEKNYSVPEGVEYISYSAAYSSLLESVVLPDSMRYIDDYAFLRSESLKSINFPNGLIRVGKCSFEGTDLTVLDFPASVRSIGDNAFGGNKNITSATIRNRECKIASNSATFGTTTVAIHGYEGSTAEEYAIMRERQFVALPEAETTNVTSYTPSFTTTKAPEAATIAMVPASIASETAAKAATTTTSATSASKQTTTTTAASGTTSVVIRPNTTANGVAGNSRKPGSKTTSICAETYAYTTEDGKEYFESIEFDVEIEESYKLISKEAVQQKNEHGYMVIFKIEVEIPVDAVDGGTLYTINVTKATDIYGNDVTAALPWTRRTGRVFVDAPDNTTSAKNPPPTQPVSTTAAPSTTTEPVSTSSEVPADKELTGSWVSYQTSSRGIPRDIPGNDSEALVLNSDFTGSISFGGKYYDITWKNKDSKRIELTGDGSTFELVHDGTDLVLYAEEGKAVYYKHGTVKYSFGDPSGDGKIDANDASFLLVEYSKLSTGADSSLTNAQRAAGDVNKDGKTDSKDASIMLAFYAYLSTGGEDTLSDFIK